MARDSQVSKAYAADHRMFARHPELELASLEECQQFITKEGARCTFPRRRRAG
jgi:hypothetical protein